MEHGANKKGHHLHTIYRKTVPHSHRSCGTTCDWESEWKKRLKESFLKHGEPKPKRTLESKHRYLEVLAVCDKKFLRFHKAIDVQTYVMTVMNMVLLIIGGYLFFGLISYVFLLRFMTIIKMLAAEINWISL